MSNDSERMRQVLNLLESCETPVNEGWVGNLKNKIKRRLGDKERKKLASDLKKQWLTWLGQTDREGTLEDMDRFMTHRIGFTDEDIDFVMHKANLRQGSDEPAEPNAEEKPIEKTIKTGAEQEEDGRPLPKDLNTKLSDYGEVGKKTNEAEDYDETVPLPDDVVDIMMNASAARINDNYLYNGPANDKADAIAQAAQAGIMKGGRGGINMNADLGKNEGGKKPSGQYDTKEMMRGLDAMGISPQTVSALLRKASMTRKPSEFTDKERKILSMIGFALLRSRT
jgi:hypothetical protein